MLSNRRSPLGIDGSVLALKKDHNCQSKVLNCLREKKVEDVFYFPLSMKISEGHSSIKEFLKLQKYSRWNVIKCLWNLFKRKFGTTHELEGSVSVEIIQ